MDEEFLRKLGLSIARGVPQMATGFVDLAALPFTMTGLLDEKDVVGGTEYLTQRGLLPPPQEGIIPETLEMLSGALSPQGVATGGLLALGTMAGKRGAKSVNQAIKTAQDEAMEVAQRNAALPVEQGGLGLPADNTAMDRAKAMGFDVNDPLYHGTKAPNIEQLIPSRGGEFGGGVYTSPDPLTANQFATYAKGESGENILPLMSRAQNPLVTSDRNIPRGMGTKTMQKKGFDSVVGTTPSGQIQNVVFDPAMLRSRFAAFDPAKRNLPDILAGLGATGIGLGLLSPMLEEEQF